MFIEAFRKLPNIVFIFKHSAELLNVPSNALIVGRIPRGNAIHHESVKAIISNGEKLTLHEAAWYHIPVIGIPLHAEQFQNIAKVVNDGVGIQLDYETLTVDNLVRGINEIFEEKYWNASDRQSMKLGSNIAHPVEIANYFIEHVTFVGEGLHLRSPIVDLPFWKLHLLDVYAVVIGLSTMIIHHIIQIFKSNKKTTLSPQKQPLSKKLKENKSPELINSAEKKSKESKKNDKKTKKSN